MAYLSEILNEQSGIPKKYREEASVCLMCGKKIKFGGMWATQKIHAGVCEKCAPTLLDWYIDTLFDVKEISEEDDIASVKKLSNDIIERYERKKKKKVQYKKKHLCFLINHQFLLVVFYCLE